MTQKANAASRSRGESRPSFASPLHPLGFRGAGKAGCRLGTRGPLCVKRKKQMHSGIQVRPNARPSLRSGFTAYVALSSGSEALLPPSSCRDLQGLTPALGRQDHTILPYATRRSSTQPASTAAHPAFRDDRDPPL